MAKEKSIRDTNGKVLPAPNATQKRVELTDANAPLFSAKFLEGIMLELKAIRELLEKQDG